MDLGRTRNHARELAFALLVVCGVAVLCGCAPGSSEALRQLKPLPILASPPPGGTELARAQDQGTIAGDEPGIAVVFASDRSAAEIGQYYESTYPEYSLHHDTSVDLSPPPTPEYAAIGSFRVGTVEATLVIRIQNGSPDLIEQGINYDLRPRSAPAGATTFVTVNVFGFVDKRPASS